VTLSDGTQIEGKTVGVDPQTDLAVITVKGASFPSAKLGESDKLMIGEWAIAIGNPFGFFINDARPTVDAGVISAVDRNFAPSEGVYYQGMIQTTPRSTRAIRADRSSIALGEVVGINTFIFTGATTIAVNRHRIRHSIRPAKRVSKELITYANGGSYTQAYRCRTLPSPSPMRSATGRPRGLSYRKYQKAAPAKRPGSFEGTSSSRWATGPSTVRPTSEDSFSTILWAIRLS